MEISDELNSVDEAKILSTDTAAASGVVGRQLPSEGVEEHIVACHDPQSPLLEHFRQLRVMTLKRAAGGKYDSLAVTSAMRGEGKSTITLNFAVTASYDVRGRVLIVDADMRRPRIHRLLGLHPELGLADLLVDRGTFSDALCATPLPNLSLLPAGKRRSSPMGLLESEKMAEIVEEAKKSFELVVIDTPPVLAVAETVRTASLADGVVLVIYGNQTKRAQAKRALDMLTGANVLGFVMNRGESAIAEYYYGYGYFDHYYYGGYGPDENN